MTQFVRNENGDVIAVTDDDPRATGDAIGASLKQSGIYQSPDGWAIVTGSPGGQLGGAPRIITVAGGKQPPADVLARFPMASPQENAGFQQQAAKYMAGEGKGMSPGTALAYAVASYFGASALGGLAAGAGGAGAAGANVAGGIGDWGGIPGASGTSNLGALSTGADASLGVNPAGTASNMTVADPWGAGNPTNLSTLAEGPSTLSGMSGNVLDTVAPAASGVGASGAALPAGWQSALGVERAAPLLSNASTLGGLSELAGPAAKAASEVAKKSAISRILDGSATAADYLSVGGAALPGVLGAITSSKQADNLKALADQYSGYGAPSRARYEASFQPGFSMTSDPGYKDALDQNAKTTLHALSVNGNPAGSPNAWEASQKDLYDKTEYPALQAYRNTNSVGGGLATGASAAPNLATQAIQQQGTTMADLGGAARDVFAPTSTIDDLVKKLKGSNNIFAVQ